MNPQIKRIVRWAEIGAVVAFLIDLAVSSGETFGVRVCLGFMVAGAGAVTGALLCAMFTADDTDDAHAPAHSSEPPRP